MERKGSTWNESETYRDGLSLRRVRRVTVRGYYNQTPTYHTNTAFTADGEFFIFARAHCGKSALFKAHTKTGDITQLVDPIDGTGCADEMQKSSGNGTGNGLGINMLASIAPRSRWAVFLAGRSVRAVQLDTLQERTLIGDWGSEWVCGMPSIDPHEQHVILPMVCSHPDIIAGRRISKSYMDYFSPSGMKHCLLQVPLAGGETTRVYEAADTHCAHCPHSPVDPDLLLIDRDRAPKYWAGSDGKSNRIWTLRLSDQKLTELPCETKFQMHAAWTFDGKGIVYHGPRASDGWYVGITAPDGRTIREYSFPKARHYGHVSAMGGGRPAIILDGNITPDQLLWLYYDQESPRLELIACHNTNWNGMAWQYPHPHAQSDASGKWIVFNSCVERGRADVFLVEV